MITIAGRDQQVRSGNVAAFERIFRRLHAPMCEVVDSYVRAQDVAEELVQDVFFAAWNRREKLPPDDALPAYLFAAARNRALHHLRHAAVVRRWNERAAVEPAVAGVASSVPLAADEIERTERDAMLRRAIDKLPPRSRVAVVLQYTHGMTQGEVASAMGISVKGVEKLVASGKKRLRELLGPLMIDVTLPG
jgi:RNA polymerase sigma-70 factor (ECF subfamily)